MNKPINARRIRRLTGALPLLICVACGGGGSGGGSGSTDNSGGNGEPGQSALARTERCLRQTNALAVGAGIDAPGRLEVDLPGIGQPGQCAGETDYQFGTGISDITGPAANTGGGGWESPTQVFSGIHSRQFSRAFAIASPCSGKRVMFVSNDQGLMFGSVRQGVLAGIAADPQLAPHYNADNLMLSATHTHQGPAGYSHYEAPNALHFGFDQLVLDTLVEGTLSAIRQAHANLVGNPQRERIVLASGELLNANIQRSAPAFAMNPANERAEFLNQRGEEIQVNKRMLQLNLLRANGAAAGIINWFGVHPTVLGPELNLVSSDHKGFASLAFEKTMHTDYHAPLGEDHFVAAFAQMDEGDSSPNIAIADNPWPAPQRGGGQDPYDSNAIAGRKSLIKALELYQSGSELSGPVDYRLFHVQMDAVTVTDPSVLATLNHPTELDTPVKRTCTAALGVSFAAGAEDGPGPGNEGITCAASPDVLAAAQQDLATLFNIDPENIPTGVLPTSLLSATLLCQIQNVPLPGADFSCQAEKPVAIPIGTIAAEPAIVPLQLFRIGNLAILGLPWEVTTMAARRLRSSLYDVLAPVGIDTIVIAGLVNDYVHYLPTREEYASQQYEGASSLFGPWALAAVQQESRKLAVSMRDNLAAPGGPDYVDTHPVLIRPPYVPSDVDPGPGFGALITDVPQAVARGETVSAEFQSAHPRNDLQLNRGYVLVERQVDAANWEVVATDKSPALLYVWKPSAPSPLPLDAPVTGPSTAEAVWTVPGDAPAGVYRLRHQGVAQTLGGEPSPFEGVSSSFEIEGAPGECP